jgi:hypothetical protein
LRTSFQWGFEPALIFLPSEEVMIIVLPLEEEEVAVDVTDQLAEPIETEVRERVTAVDSAVEAAE